MCNGVTLIIVNSFFEVLEEDTLQRRSGTSSWQASLYHEYINYHKEDRGGIRDRARIAKLFFVGNSTMTRSMPNDSCSVMSAVRMSVEICFLGHRAMDSAEWSEDEEGGITKCITN